MNGCNQRYCCVEQKGVLHNENMECGSKCGCNGGPCPFCGSGLCCRKGQNKGWGCNGVNGCSGYHCCVNDSDGVSREEVRDAFTSKAAQLCLKFKQWYLWDKGEHTWTITKYSNTISKKKVKEVLQKAFDMFSKVIPLTFKFKEDGKATFQIKFSDFPPGKLGDSTWPSEGNTPGQIRFDDSRNWKESREPGPKYWLLHTALHEISHALGLCHSNNNKDAVGTGRRAWKVLQLSKTDIRRLQRLYGPPAGQEKLPPPLQCSIHVIDAMAADKDGNLYVFGEDKVVTFNMTKRNPMREVGYRPLPIGDVFPGAPIPVKAAVLQKQYDNDGNQVEVMQIFDGTTEYRYRHNLKDSKFSLMMKQPIAKSFPNMPKPFLKDGGIDAAAYDFDQGHYFFFKEDEYWSSSNAGANDALQISQKWPGLPDVPIRAASYVMRYVHFEGKWKPDLIYVIDFLYPDGSEYLYNEKRFDGKAKRFLGVRHFMGCLAQYIYG